MKPGLTLAMALGAALLAAASVRAETPVIAQEVPSARLVGEGRMTFLGFSIFDAALFAPDGAYSPDAPFALRLTYHRSFKGEAIADKSVTEIRDQMGDGVSEARLMAWRREMEAIFPDVSDGMSITGVRDAEGHARFFSGGRALGTIRDRSFARHFFDIWLGQDTDDPDLRNRLVGAGSP